ncbi:hypothetical protein AgCh_006964 [Apium graveolens]
MAETSQNGGDSASRTGIPTGLNRIKTRPVLKDPLSSKLTGFKGMRKEKKIPLWLRSNVVDPALMDVNSNNEAHEKKGLMVEMYKVRKHQTRKHTLGERKHLSKMSKGSKSFSHALGRKGGIRLIHPRPYSFADLKEFLGALRSRFSAAKEVVNSELTCFTHEVVEVLQKNDLMSPLEIQMIEGLLILAQQCLEMTSFEFRSSCEIIVQDLTEKRQRNQTEVLKWLFTRMLFILTRCTRLLHFEKDSEHIDEKSFLKFKECLKRVPSCEMNWVMNTDSADSDSDNAQNLRFGAKDSLKEKNQSDFLQLESCWGAEVPLDESLKNVINDLMVSKKTSSEASQTEALSDRNQQLHEVDEETVKISDSGLLTEQNQNTNELDLVICRICEELVSSPQLEPHSYICAYADKCDLNCSNLDERLQRHAEVLEQILDSLSLTVNATYDIPEGSILQTNSSVISDVYSPKISEWRSKGAEGMFEDIHEMDTAYIEDAPLATFANIRGHSGLKKIQGPPSSAESMTSTSSANTPRSGSFDFSWIEHQNPSELDDVQQITDLVNIARCVADTDPSEEGFHECLLACLEDLQDILQHSKHKALLIETFGCRIENLLREKYILACDLVDSRSVKSDSGMSPDNTSQSSRMSTPKHKERTSIDDFEIIKPISKGAYGKVFLARKRATGDLFAIKVLKKLDMLRKNDIERIVAERNILIRVRNPFVVRFFYSFTSKENLYLVMEYLNGGDLYSLVRNVGCLEEDVARVYIAELVLALEYLHTLEIVHRDVKPDNILIAHDGHIKLTDFGLSKIGLMNRTSDLSGFETNGLAPTNANSDKIKKGADRSQQSAVGTPDYLAPEILLGSKHGYAADWWSVGIILFELITGIPPFTGEHLEIIFENILNRTIPWPPVPKDMSPEAQDLIDRLLLHDPNQRLGAEGSSEVKAHPFFRGINWENLASQKAAFVPHPDSVDDTSYFVSRFTESFTARDNDRNSSNSDSDTTDSFLNSEGREKLDDCGDLAEFESSPLDLSLMNFSFKNLSQLASINREVLLQSGKESSRSSSPYKDRGVSLSE